MSSILLPRRYFNRPSGLVGLNREHGLAKFVTGAWIFGDQITADLAGRNAPLQCVGHTRGPGHIRVPSGSGASVLVGGGTQFRADSEGTVLARFRLLSTWSTGRVAPLFGFGNYVDAGDELCLFGVRSHSGTGFTPRLDVTIRNADYVLYPWAGSTTIQPGVWVNAAFTVGANGVAVIWKDGAQESLTAWTGGATTTTWISGAMHPNWDKLRFKLAGTLDYQGTAFQDEVDTELIVYFNKRLGSAELKSITVNPWQIFRVPE